MSAFGKKGRRCDWCGKFSTNRIGEYTKPDGISCGYINTPDWERENDQGHDICEECYANLCPHCGSDQIVTGPDGWGGRCKACGKRWDIPYPSCDERPA